jgi:hypothetical protein
MRTAAVRLLFVFVTLPALFAAAVPAAAQEPPELQLLGLGDDPSITPGSLRLLERTLILQSTAGDGALTVSGGPTLTATGGLDIVLNKGATLSTNTAASAAFDRAAAFWESVLFDPVTITIDADLGPLGQNVIGGTNPTVLAGDFDFLRDVLVADQAVQQAGDITQLLPSDATASFIVPAIPLLVQYDIGGLSLTSANARALGLEAAIPATVTRDAAIIFSNQFNFDFDRSDGIDPNAIDFEGVAIHEIGHALGFISEVDTVDTLLAALQGATLFPSTLDLFRIEPGNDSSTFTAAPRLLIPGIDLTPFGPNLTEQISFFGITEQYQMATGTQFGDGDQASHFKDDLGIGILDPTFAFGEFGVVTAADLRAFDLIGWDLVAIPLPAALWLLIGGLGVLIITKRSV